MKYFAWLLCLTLFCSCNTDPRPLVIGKDECDFCKMPVVNTKFGAELITQKGKLYKFDDMICMMNFLENTMQKKQIIKNIFPVNYTNNQKFTDINQSVFLVSQNFRTPMNSGIAAFETQQEATLFLKDFPGKIITWDQLQQKNN
jgi:copper chaperone NosL